MNLLLISAFFLSASAMQAEDPPKARNKEEIEKIVREYILQHPEVLIESIRLFQERERSAALEKGKAAIQERQADLLNDPTSPMTGKQGEAISVVMFFDYRHAYCIQLHPT